MQELQFSETAFIAYEDLLTRVTSVLINSGLSKEQSKAVSVVICQAERDGCYSHGLYRLPWCIRSIEQWIIAKNAIPEIRDDQTVIVKVNANHGFSSLSFKQALPILKHKAKTFGLTALIINDCYHFSALWPEAEAIADEGLAAIVLTPSHTCVAPFGGIKPLLGTNPFAFSWSRLNQNPYVFDFATSMVARGEIEILKRQGKSIPISWALDTDGQPTTDPIKALPGSMLTFGGHKGSALSTMIELLGGILIGDLTSKEAMDFDDRKHLIPFHGELVIAFDPRIMSGLDFHKINERTEDFFHNFLLREFACHRNDDMKHVVDLMNSAFV